MWVVLLVCLAGAVTASAHRPVVVRPGTATIDQGRLPAAQATWATVGRDEQLDATIVMAAGEALRIDLLVPDREPERDLGARQRPTLVVDLDADGPLPAEQVPRDADREPARVVEPHTGTAYLRIARMDVPPQAGDRNVAMRVRGRAPAARVVLAAGGGGELELDEGTAPPRVVARILEWYGPGDPDSDDRNAALERWRFLPVLVVLAMVLLAGWWVWRGRTIARLRGSRRPDRERDVE